MSVVAVALRELIALGVSGDALIAAVERIEAAAVVERASTVREAVEIASRRADAELVRAKSKGAERMAKYRATRAANGLEPSFDGGRYAAGLRERDGDACVYCATAPGHVVDHMHPVSRGGTDDWDNLALSCVACNCGKAGRLLSEGGSEIKSATARAAHVRYVREHVRDVRDGANADPLPLPPFPQTPKPPTPTPGSVFTRVREDGDFDLFWTVYPKRIGKADARKAFSKALKSADLQTILCAVERQREWEQWQRGFAPHPATWLNGQRWSDEEPATPATPPRAPHERPHHDAKFEARQANLSRAFAGADRAAGRDWKP